MGKIRRLDLIAITGASAVKEIKFGVCFKSLLSSHPKPFIKWNITKETADPLRSIKMSVRCRFQFWKLTTLWWVLSYLMGLSYHSKSYCAVPCSNAYKWICLCDVGGVMWQIRTHITTGGLMWYAYLRHSAKPPTAMVHDCISSSEVWM